MTKLIGITLWILSYVAASLAGSFTLLLVWAVGDWSVGDLQLFIGPLLVIAINMAVLAFPFALIFSIIPELRSVAPRPLLYGIGGMLAGFAGAWLMQYSLILPDGVLATLLSRAPFMIAGAVAGLIFGLFRRAAFKRKV